MLSSKKSVLICDDEQDARMLLRQYSIEHPQLAVVGECINGIESVIQIDHLKPDLVFLDVSMPGLDGFQVLSSITHQPQVIFSTAYDRYALQAFDKDAIDYLLKPFARERFQQAVRKALARTRPDLVHDGRMNYTSETIFAQSGDKLVSVALKDITWIEANGDYSRIHVGHKFFLSNSGMNMLESKLPTEYFIRIHRSAIVNIEMISQLTKSVNGFALVMKNGTVHKIGRMYLERVKRLIV